MREELLPSGIEMSNLFADAMMLNVPAPTLFAFLNACSVRPRWQDVSCSIYLLFCRSWMYSFEKVQSLAFFLFMHWNTFLVLVANEQLKTSPFHFFWHPARYVQQHLSFILRTPHRIRYFVRTRLGVSCFQRKIAPALNLIFRRLKEHTAKEIKK